YARFLSSAGDPVGDELRVNSTTINQQMHPAVASDGSSRFLVVWTGFIGGGSSFDLFGQRYALSQALPTPAAPFVYAPFAVDASDGDGASNLQEFLAGTAPADPNSVMRVQIVSTAQGATLTWNSQPGFIYQVEASENLDSWTNFGAPRFATGTNDSIPANGTG